ncbi:hypothetical protein FUAX_10480 [Fulvitalea axinellae]|uniref:DUF2975 domain-containing protein n=1 Tax=Fulvitalea axinellae TaxID=1182444 RepID=A0AAU9C905_9BACT|nr:hypothetical protein FUAX_10480 [Fulvitalea axinellae]
MSKRDLFILLLKLFGLYSLVSSFFFILPSVFSYVTAMNSMSPSAYDIYLVLFTGFTLVGIVVFFAFVLFKAPWIVEKLKLAKGFDNDWIEIGKLSAHDIIRIGVFMLGGLILVDNIAEFINTGYYVLKSDIAGFNFSWNENIPLAISGIKLLVGVLLVTNYDRISGLLKTDQTGENVIEAK